jgi:AcrR family transcriptional regulator
MRTSGTPLRQEPAKVRNRRRVLESARALVTEHGLDALTMRRIALEADVSVTSLYNLIGGRDDVVRAVALYMLEELNDAVVHVEANDPLEQTHNVLSVLIDTITEEVPRPLLLALLDDAQLIRDLGPRWPSGSTLGDAIRSMVTAGMLNDDLAAKAIAKQVWLSYMGYLRQWAGGVFGDQEFRAVALYSLDLGLLAAAKPATRKRLLAHARALEKKLPRF